jgi:hypothetical protein
VGAVGVTVRGRTVVVADKRLERRGGLVFRAPASPGGREQIGMQQRTRANMRLRGRGGGI